MIVKNKNASDFLTQNEELLLLKESEYNLLLGLAGSIAKGVMPGDEATFLTLIEPNSHAQAQALRTSHERGFILSEMTDNQVDEFIAFLKEYEIEVSEIHGPFDTVEKFAKKYYKEMKLKMHQGIYEATSIIFPKKTIGEMIIAEDEHKTLVKQFALAFINDCDPDFPDKEKSADDFIKRCMPGQQIYLLRNSSNEIVCMTAMNRESQNGATMSWVYTPTEFRGRRYASELVAKVSQRYLDKGKKFCNLFTDLANPTSNSIYQKIGYVKLGESLNLKILN